MSASVCAVCSDLGTLCLACEANASTDASDVDTEHGVHPRAARVWAAIIEEDRPLATQHLAKRGSLVAACGEYGHTVEIDTAITCEACKAVVAKRKAARLAKAAQAPAGRRRRAVAR